MEKLIGMIKRRKSLILASAFAPICFGALVVGMGTSQLQEVKKRVKTVSPNEIKIVNNTTTLEATFEITATNNLLLRLKNLSSKDVNGYVVAVNNGRIKCDMSSGDQTLPSGQTTDLELPIRSSSTTLTILAAMFADGSIEAEPVLKTELSEWRLGLKKELARGLNQLNAILESPDGDSTEALDRLSSRLSPSLDSDVVRSHSESGTRDARDSFTSHIQSLRERAQRNGTLRQRQRLLDLKASIERRIASF